MTAREKIFLEALELSVTVGDYFFTHAGARPGLALDRQTPQDLLWIRRPFLDSGTEFERIVVHGHTPTAAVHADRRRIGIDTKAYESGVLTALRLDGRDRTLVRAVGPRRASGAHASTRPKDDHNDGGAFVCIEKMHGLTPPTLPRAS